MKPTMKSTWLIGIAIVLTLFAGSLGFEAALAQDVENGEEEVESETLSEAEAASQAARELLEAMPDPAQAATQASEEALGQGTPRKEEQLVYSVNAWTGTEFAGTFSPKDVDTIYLIADTTSIVNTQRTEVYYWPITSEYMADWFNMREPVDGTLEVLKDGEVVQTFERTDYVYYYPTGHSGRQELVLGDEAVATYEDYQARLDAYFRAVSEYNQAYRDWQSMMNEIIREVQETGEYRDPDTIPPAPERPEPPGDFAYQPREAFAVKLPEGRYQVRLRAPDGSIVADSQKKLDVFSPRREGVGYGVIPEHRWTRRFQSNDTSDTFYLDGHRVFYLLPFDAKEYNRYKFVKMTNLHKPLEGEGTRSAWMWTHTDAIEEGTLQVLRDGEVIEEIERMPYYVRQTPGYALGYEIVPFDPENDPILAGRQPTFEAYRVELAGDGGYELRFVDAQGRVAQGSQRTVRTVSHPGSSLYYVAFVPLGIGFIAFGYRRLRARKGTHKEN